MTKKVMIEKQPAVEKPVQTHSVSAQLRIEVATAILAGFAGNDHINMLVDPTGADSFVTRSINLADKLLKQVYESQS